MPGCGLLLWSSGWWECLRVQYYVCVCLNTACTAALCLPMARRHRVVLGGSVCLLLVLFGEDSAGSACTCQVWALPCLCSDTPHPQNNKPT